MVKRLNGVVVEYDSNGEKIKGKVEVKDSGPFYGQEVPLVSAHNEIPLTAGLHVDFIFTTMEVDGNTINVAYDIRPICPSMPIVLVEEEDLPVQGGKETSFLHTLADRVERDLRSQVASNTREANGSGGAKHRFLQQFVKELAEEKGFQAVIEETIPNGSVDVGLMGPGIKIACEIPVSTVYSEFKNIRKCLQYGYDYVISVSTERSVLDAVERTTSPKLSEDEKKKVLYLLPEELSDFLSQLDLPEVPDKIINGRVVRVRYRTVGDEEIRTRRAKICQVLVDDIRKKKQEALSKS